MGPEVEPNGPSGADGPGRTVEVTELPSRLEIDPDEYCTRMDTLRGGGDPPA